MRFLLLVAAAVVAGAVSVFSLTTFFPQQRASVVAAMRVVGDRAAQFRLADLNPLRRNYDYVIGEVTSPKAKLDFPSSPPIVVDPTRMGTLLGNNQSALGGGLSMKNNAGTPWQNSSRPAMMRCSRGGIIVPCD